MLSVGGDGAVGGFLPWSERPLREVSLASCGDAVADGADAQVEEVRSPESRSGD